MRSLEFSQRLKKFPPYLFAEIDRQKSSLKRKGVDFIDLSVGDPDILAPKKVVDALCRAAKVKGNQKYALDQGSLKLRNSIKVWMKNRFSVNLDEDKQILPLIGSKEGLVHFPLAIVNRGDYVIIPSPGYPGYRGGALFSEAKVYDLALLEKNDFLPDLSSIPLKVRNRAKIIYMNYPHNPTTALAPKDFLEKLVSFCSKYGIVLAYDNAYSEIYFEQKPHSILEIKGANEIAIEFHSLSKTFCMTGFRIGWAAGSQNLIKALLKVKANTDSGIFGAIQEAGRVALEGESAYVRSLRRTLRKRRDFFVEKLSKYGVSCYANATFYVWTKIPEEFDTSLEFSKYLLTKKGIVATPGAGFGKFGEGFIRFALTVDNNRLKEVFRNKLF